MNVTQRIGRLFIEGQHVGDIAIDGWTGPWGIGRFNATGAFEPFMPIFAEWSRLMHADPGPISDEVSNRLRELEYQMYALQCRLFLVEPAKWRQILILNIDGSMIEWKDGWIQEDQEAAANSAILHSADDALANVARI